ncbi:MAG: leucine-rich repeat domain-containing protein [Bacteroidetes bacterium]|nr:leucine-rich repeat domain-containing protein [Bacteroidota bacterium]
MTETFPKKPEKYIEDLADFDNTQTSLHLSANAKNIDRLKNLQIEYLWLIGAKEKNLQEILSLIQPKYLNLYYLPTTNLTFLETLNTTQTLILEWNTKTTSLWDLSKNIGLKNLKIIDFPKLNDISQISIAKQLDSFTLQGGINNQLSIQTLKPISVLTNLKYLRLANLKVFDDTLKYLANLKNLEELSLSNQFETKEYAWLSSRLPNVKCDMFQATVATNITNANNEIVWDTMVVGRRKPFLNSKNDKAKIDKYITDFEKLKRELA